MICVIHTNNCQNYSYHCENDKDYDNYSTERKSKYQIQLYFIERIRFTRANINGTRMSIAILAITIVVTMVKYRYIAENGMRTL